LSGAGFWKQLCPDLDIIERQSLKSAPVTIAVYRCLSFCETEPVFNWRMGFMCELSYGTCADTYGISDPVPAVECGGTASVSCHRSPHEPPG